MDKNNEDLVKEWEKRLKDEGLAPLYNEVAIGNQTRLYQNYNDKDISRIYKNSSDEYVQEHIEYFKRAGILAEYYPVCKTPRQKFEKKVWEYHVAGLTTPEMRDEFKKVILSPDIYLFHMKKSKEVPSIDTINVIIQRHDKFLLQLSFNSIAWPCSEVKMMDGILHVPNPIHYLMKQQKLTLFLKEK